MGSRSRLAAIASVHMALGLALWPRVSQAMNCSGVTSTCINDDSLWPHAGPANFVAVGSAQTVGSEQLSFGLVTTYLSRPIVLHLPTPGGAASTNVQAIDDQANATFAWAYGVTDRLELDLALPLTLGQSGLGLSPVTGGTGLHDTATRDMRFGTTFTIVPEERKVANQPLTWGLAARFEVSAPTGDDDQFAGEHFGVFVPGVSADVRYDRFFGAVELGARIRPASNLLGARVGTQIVTALGLGVDLLPRELLSLGIESWALPTLDEQTDVVLHDSQYLTTPNGHHITPAEWMISARSAPVHGGDLSFQLGGGGGLPLDGGDLPITVPRFRFTLGVRWAPRAQH